MVLLYFFFLPSLTLLSINDCGIRLPALASLLIRFVNDANCERLAPVTPDRYFLGTPDLLSLGTFRLFAIAISKEVFHFRM